MAYTAAQKRRVYLACKAIFSGNNSCLRKQKSIRKLVDKHKWSLISLTSDYGEGKVVDMLKLLLEQGIFDSELLAQREFPELFRSSPARDVQRTASEDDAARSTAGLLDEIQSVEGRDEDLTADADSPDELLTANVDIEATLMPVNNLVPEDIPSLYPSYLPYTVQHAILNTAQRVLEECCFEFAQQWLPSVLRSRQWDCAVAVELTKWTRILSKSSAELPADALKLRGSELTEILFTTNKLRHTAVHRLPTTARGIDAFLQAASKLAEALQDSLRTAQLDELHSELENKIKAMELNKNALEDGLSRELRDIRRQREVLDQKEREVKEAMVKEDGENKALIGSLLEESVRRIFAEGGVLRGEERERALDDSEDEDAAAYKEACEEASPQGSE